MQQTPSGPCPGLGRAGSSWLVPPALPGLAPALVAQQDTGTGMAEAQPASRASSQWLWVPFQVYKSPGGGEGAPLLSILSPSVTLHGWCCLEQVTAQARSEMLRGVLQAQSCFGVTQGRCCGVGFAFLQQTDCFNEE